MENECMLTTFDNPYDPFEQFTLWNLYDLEKGYNTCSHLARILQDLPDDLSESEREEAEENAIDMIIENDFMNIYKKVKKETKDKTT